MRYATDVAIDLPRADVLRLLADRRNDKLWRPDLEMCEPITGEPGWPGAQTRLLYRHTGGGVRERMEHIVANRLPESLELSLVSPSMTEHQLHRFSEIGCTATRWTIESDVEFHHAGFALRRHSSLLEQDSQRAMEAFKVFAEGPDAHSLLVNQHARGVPDPRIHMREPR